MTNPDLCTIAFKSEAHDSAAQAFHQLESWVVTVVPTEGEAFDATVIGLAVDETNGQYQARFAKWNEEAGTGDPNDVVTLDIYDDIERVEVI